MTTPDDRRYTKDHEWLLVVDTKAKLARVGITDHAQKQLGDVVFVELPSPGEQHEATEPFGSVESVKAVTEVYMPVSGGVHAVNETLHDTPELLNTDPYGDGWMIEVTMSAPAEVDDLLTAAEYDAYVREEASD